MGLLFQRGNYEIGNITMMLISLITDINRDYNAEIAYSHLPELCWKKTAESAAHLIPRRQR